MRYLLGGYLCVCCEFAAIYVCQMICRDASVDYGVEKAMDS